MRGAAHFAACPTRLLRWSSTIRAASGGSPPSSWSTGSPRARRRGCCCRPGGRRRACTRRCARTRPPARSAATGRPCSSSTSTPASGRPTRTASPRSCASSCAACELASLHTIDGSASDLDAEAARHEAVLEAAPIDVAVLGLGRDGHVAFDEPPARMASGVHVVDLAAETREDAAIGFGGLERVPARALTTGLGTLYRARELIVLVTGAVKAPALRAMLEEPVGPASPGLAAARPPAADGDLRPRRRAAAHPPARVDERPRARRARPPRAGHQRRAPDLDGVARAAPPRGRGSPASPRSAPSSSPATRRPAGCRRPSR